MLTSRFRFFGYVPAVLTLMVFLLFARKVDHFLKASEGSDPALALCMMAFLFLVLLWLVMGELRTKALSAKIGGGNIVIRNFYGLGASKTYLLADFYGYTTSLLSSKNGSYEYLYLMKDGKKQVKLSEYYHTNYDQLKAELRKSVHDHGDSPFRLIDEFKEVLK